MLNVIKPNRVGLVGNPSDGFYGKTISLSIENFWAEVSIKESRELVRLFLLLWTRLEFRIVIKKYMYNVSLRLKKV